jgi:ABC-type glycerol-3-phosphate transport system substrate-binding protein
MRWASVALAGVTVAACAAVPDSPDLSGTEVEVIGVWQDAEAAAFERVLGRFELDTGATVTYTSTAGDDLAAVLDERFAAGDPPDIAVLPQPGLLRDLARSGRIRPVESLVGDVVDRDWGPIWQQLGSVDGELYGVWYKAAHKSLVWYSIGAFERIGVVPPDDLAGLTSIANELSAAGITAFSVTGTASDAWTMTDWFENLYLRLAGPDRYDELAEHRLAWTDPSVEETLRVMATLLAPSNVTTAEGPETTFTESVEAVFSTDPTAAMVMEGDFVPGVAAATTAADLSVDVDMFAFPGRTADDRFVVGGGDAVVLMRDSVGGAELVRFLATPEAASVWAALGGFVSPNESVDLTAYPDPTTQRIARSLIEAGDGFRFDLSDLQPVAFGGTRSAGMWLELARFAADPTDLGGTMERLEAAAVIAWAA